MVVNVAFIGAFIFLHHYKGKIIYCRFIALVATCPYKETSWKKTFEIEFT
jgi:hypothetical protein